MQTVITVFHVIGALILIVAILLQAGKGAAMGAGLGGGSSQTMFGSGGAGNFLTKLTTGVAILFMVTSLTLAILSTKKDSRSIMQGIEQPVKSQEAPVEPLPSK
ncbi:MAG: preprotein translocase subunit SecG [Nitrospinae bacterium]|jgi:preprotein translocase subunit SecG|nr:preprotein translocase subunit SecG [Nitrospinota bacterium]MDA1108458.1 preprotein translocase subunit SecG [Nitrospinota bacterium]